MKDLRKQLKQIRKDFGRDVLVSYIVKAEGYILAEARLLKTTDFDIPEEEGEDPKDIKKVVKDYIG